MRSNRPRTLTLLVARDCAPAAPLRDYIALVDLRHEVLRGLSDSTVAAAALQFVEPPSGNALPFTLTCYDSDQGRLTGWLRLPLLDSAKPMKVALVVDDASNRKPMAPSEFWPENERLMVQATETGGAVDQGPRCHGCTPVPGANGTTVWRVSHQDEMCPTDAITVEAWFDHDEPRAEAMQTLVSKWALDPDFAAFDAHDAGCTDGLDTTGFFGAVFDGRYIYFVPQHDLENRHGKVLRLDTHGGFHDAASWAGFDAGTIGGLVTKGYYGAVHTGRCIFFCPRREPLGFHSRVLRYDTQGDFKDAGSWDVHDAGLANSCQSAAYDGRFIYFCPGQEARPKPSSNAVTADDSPRVTGMSSDQLLISSGTILRHDTARDFHDLDAWTTFDASGTCGLNTRDFDGAVFDGRYVYFMPLSYGAVLRYDTQADFHLPGSWAAFDAARLGVTRLVGGVFDGRYVYLVPYGVCPVAVRYDTGAPFEADSSWQHYRLARTPGLRTSGYDGGFFDGRYIFYTPYWDEDREFHGLMLRYDTLGDFLDPDSWLCTDAGLTAGLKTVGFNAGATDGRFLYCAPWMDGQAFPGRIIGNGRVLRYDTTGQRASFCLRSSDYGSNGGLCAALPGPRFLINTSDRVFSVAADRPLPVGRHHLVGTYDGRCLRLFLDGEEIACQPARGSLAVNRTDVVIGGLAEGEAPFQGAVLLAGISSSVRSPDWVRMRYHNLANPVQFLEIMGE